MKENQKSKEINAASMADIAFLLLLFFMVATTLQEDKGLLQKLPELDVAESKPLHKRNVLELVVNSNDALMVRGEEMPLDKLAPLMEQHIVNHGRLPNFSDKPQLAIVSLVTHRGASYNTYLTIHNLLKEVYTSIRDKEAASKTAGKFNYKQLAECAKKNKNCLVTFETIKAEYSPHLIEKTI